MTEENPKFINVRTEMKMNYEELYRQLQTTEKGITDRLLSAKKQNNTVGKDTESGDIKTLLKDVQLLSETVGQLSEALTELRSQISAFDTRTYFESGEFEAQMLDLCRENEIDVHAEAPVYEMFPYRVRVDAENQDLYLDRKKVQCMRPASFVSMVKAGQTKLNKVSFNPAAFSAELADAYDVALLKSGKKVGTDIYLQSLYKLMTPMSRSRKEYDQQSFAFDLARLYEDYLSGKAETKTGRQFQFGPARNSGKSIRILDRSGKEYYLTTICFY